MKPAFQTDGVGIYPGDSLDVMRGMPPDSVDTFITDPPYGLSFMGKGWDHGVPGVPYWEAALRLAKPGAMLLAFGGTRTFHRLTCCIEDSGWEIRDCLMWLYGSGFPKSLDVSKAIDKAAGLERQVVGHGSNAGRRSGKKETQGIAFADDEYTRPPGDPITVPASDAAREWNGWGTALKPAWEPIILAMKPTDGTFVDNALAHGVAGLNIDGGRIGTDQTVTQKTKLLGIKGKNHRPNHDTHVETKSVNVGRWPANVILDDEAGRALDQQAGELTSGIPAGIKAGGKLNAYGTYGGGIPVTGYGDSGGASRFFYCAKASGSERGDDNNHPTVKPLALMRYLARLTNTPTGGVVMDPFLGSGTTAMACWSEGRKVIGIEKDPDYIKIAADRIRRHTHQPGLFGGGQ